MLYTVPSHSDRYRYGAKSDRIRLDLDVGRSVVIEPRPEQFCQLCSLCAEVAVQVFALGVRSQSHQENSGPLPK